jgi:hypothetical protein
MKLLGMLMLLLLVAFAAADGVAVAVGQLLGWQRIFLVGRCEDRTGDTTLWTKLMLVSVRVREAEQLIDTTDVVLQSSSSSSTTADAAEADWTVWRDRLEWLMMLLLLSQESLLLLILLLVLSVSGMTDEQTTVGGVAVAFWALMM